MAKFKLLFVVLIGIYISNVVSIFNPLLTYTMRFKKVFVQPNFTGKFTINQYRDNQFINGDLKINSKELIDKVIAIFYRCDPDGINCEYFQTWTFTDICLKLMEKNQVWSRWYGSFDPPMVCPLDKINYRMNNGTVDINQVVKVFFDAADYQWKVIQKMYSGDIHIGNFIAEASLFGYRKKRKPLIPQLEFIQL